jgi:hypothetical protein
MIEVISPAGFENFFQELSDLLAAGPPPLEVLAELGSNYGLQFSNPDWLPDVINRYGLTLLPRN